MTMTKINYIRGVNERLAKIEATTADLSLAEKQALVATLEKDIKAAAEKQDGPKTRLAAVKAAAVSRDPRTSEAYKSAS
jgi:hypothetical protein